MTEESKDARKTVLITGCTPGGIGHSLALAFHSRGYRVLATSRLSSLPSLSPLSTKNGIETLPLDVTSAESVAECLEAVTTLTKGRGLDYLVNNAGVNYTMPVLDLDVESEVQKTFNTNVYGVMRMCQAFAHLLIQAKGTIVMLGSVAGIMPYVFGGCYNASKAALHAYSNTLRVELAPFGVRVITVVTGGVKSNIAAHITRVLPEGSRYAELDQQYRRRQEHSQEGAMNTDSYAESVVKQVLVGPWPWRWFQRDARRSWIWEGNKSWLVWFVAGGWSWNGLLFFDWYFTKVFGLWKLRGTST